MATATATQAKATQAKATQAKATQAKATPAKAAQAHTTGPYRGAPAWVAAHAAATAAAKGAPAYRAALQVVTHLAWRTPTGAVAWHRGTNATMLGTATEMGITTGQPVQEAMHAAVTALGKAATTPAQEEAATALLTLVGTPAK